MSRKLGVALSAGLLLGALASGVHANPALPNLTNQNFTMFTGVSPKASFSAVNPVGWTGGTGLIFIDSQTFAQSAAGPVYLTTYGNPTGKVKGNYVEADGNPSFESGFNFTVTGLTPGKTYTLTFYQGASSQVGFGFNPVVGRNTATTNRWIVSLGTQGMQICTNCGTFDPLYGQTSTYFNNDKTASIAASPLMTVPYQGTVGWGFVSVNLTADSTTDLLSFLAWGDNGSTVNLPPIAFLSGVDSPTGLGSVPEPTAWALMGMGVLGLGAAMRANRRRAATA